MKKPLIVTAALATVASGVGVYAWIDAYRPPVLEIYVYALQVGSAIFIRTPEDRRILIGGGGTGDVIRSITSVLPFYSRRIDMLIATNDDDREMTGLVDVVNRYSIDEAYVPALTSGMISSSTSPRLAASAPNASYRIFRELLLDKHIPVREVTAADEIVLGNNVIARVLFPAALGSFEYSSTNKPELALQILYGSNSVALLGNISKKIETYLASSSDLEAANVIVTGGSAQPTNTSFELIQKLQPTTLIYSRAGSNSSPKKTLAKPTSQKKPPPDPWAAVLEENRFNLREGKSVKIVSDGHTLKTQFWQD